MVDGVSLIVICAKSIAMPLELLCSYDGKSIAVINCICVDHEFSITEHVQQIMLEINNIFQIVANLRIFIKFSLQLKNCCK